MIHSKMIIREIGELTTKIKSNYPEFYRSLDEDPISIPATNEVHINKQVLKDYLNSLKQLLVNYSRNELSEDITRVKQ